MLRVVTVATSGEGYFDYLVKSCKRHGIFLEVLGMGQKWQGFNWRTTILMEYLENLPEHELVCIVDAYDVIVTSNACEIMKRFWDMTAQHRVKIIAGCENPLNPMTKWFARGIFGSCKNKLLNAGTYIGQVKHLKVFLQSMQQLSNDPKDDDQQLMTKICHKNPNMVHIDVENELFLTLNSSFSKVHVPIVEKEIVLPSGARPCILHANGSTRIDHVIRDLGYDVPGSFIRYMDLFTKDALVKKITYYTKKIIRIPWFWVLILFIFFFIMKFR